MTQPRVYFVGTHEEVAHHAQPIQERWPSSTGLNLEVTISEPEEAVRLAQRGDLAVFYSEHFERFRHACQQMRQNHVATLYMIDGILEWRNAWVNRHDEVASPFTMRPVLSHKVACIGNSQARVLESWGNEGKTEVVGIPRLDSWTSEPRTQATDGPIRILVMTAKTPAFTEAQWQAVRQSLRDLKNFSEQTPTINGRPASWRWRLTHGLADELGVENCLNNLTGSDLSTALKQTDVVISTPSTAMVEAMLMNVPVACLDYHNCPHYVAAAWDIASCEHIQPALTSMARCEEKRLLFQQNQLYDTLYRETPATDRMIELLDAMLRTVQRHPQDQPLTFPAHMLPASRQVSAAFCHQKLFPTMESFAIHDQTRLQVEHEQAQREIARLKNELRQLQDELGQAHQIFDSIQQHPIAGPIVRIRQKILDFMAGIKNRQHNSQVNPTTANGDSIHNE